jgi:deoxyribodipyrimidine photo-lyase
MPAKPVIVWFRNDLRLTDHRALTAALATGAPVVPLYIHDLQASDRWASGGASRWWLHHSLQALTRSLQARGGDLVLRAGPADRVLAEVAAETDAGAVYFSRAYEPWARAAEEAVKQRLGSDGIEVKRFAGAMLREPEEVRTKAGEPFKVYTPFWRASIALGPPARPLPAPDAIAMAVRGKGRKLTSERLEEWRLTPSKPDWAGGLRATWSPGEEGAHARLDAFLATGLAGYADRRNLPAVEGTSRLSPHLHFGEITPHICWHRASEANRAAKGADIGLETFLKELVWREFSYHLLFHWPTLPEQPFKAEFSRFPWSGDEANLVAWQRGRTGYPIVDAGMRELWHTGWMHNRVRMIVASFLIKHLLIPWQAGEQWFWDTLVDADLASNAASWQWVAGSGADAAPYFRIFNPVSQGEKFDAEAAYVRRWVPEIARLPDDVIHAPWTASASVLAKAGVKLGETYPLPVVDHAAARQRALDGYAAIRAAPD